MMTLEEHFKNREELKETLLKEMESHRSRLQAIHEELNMLLPVAERARVSQSQRPSIGQAISIILKDKGDMRVTDLIPLVNAHLEYSPHPASVYLELKRLHGRGQIKKTRHPERGYLTVAWTSV